MSKRKWSKEEIEEYRNTHSYLFYCNKDDSNIIINKKIGTGISLNFANPISWILILIPVAVIIFMQF